jgi:hypothetical protein
MPNEPSIPGPEPTKRKVAKGRFFASLATDATSIRADLSYRRRLLEVYKSLLASPSLQENQGLLAPLPAWADAYELTEDSLQAMPRLQAALAGVTAYTPSKWLLEQELSKRTLHADGSEPTWSQASGKDVFEAAADSSLTGLGLSGGGIRSATFCLGVLQALAAYGKLKNFDYLSSVSGGGYIHQWLISWSWNEKGGFPFVDKHLIPLPSPHSKAGVPEQITWLRRYSSYLTPRRGMLSADTWTMITTWLRNTTLNQVVLFSFLALCVSTMRFATWPFVSAHTGRERYLSVAAEIAAIGLVAMLIVAVIAFARALRSLGGKAEAGRLPSGALGSFAVTALIAVPSLLAAYAVALAPLYAGASTLLSVRFALCTWAAYTFLLLLSITLWGRYPQTWRNYASQDWGFPKLVLFVLSAVAFAGMALFLANWTLGPVPAAASSSASAQASTPTPAPASKVSFIQTIFEPAWVEDQGNLKEVRLLCVFRKIAGALDKHLVQKPIMDAGCLSPARKVNRARMEFFVALLGPPLFLFFQFLAFRLHVGILGKYLPEPCREWLARYGACSAIVSIVWMLLAAIALFGPFVLDAFLSAQVQTKLLALLGALATHFVTLYSGSSSKTAGTPDPTAKLGYTPLDVVGIVGAPLCILMLLLVVSAIVALAGGESVHLSMYVFVANLCIFLLFGWRVDVNKFSMSPFYRNRIARCYLGGTNPNRTPDPFTGFDQHEENSHITNTGLSMFLPKRFGGTPSGVDGHRSYEGPFPIFNSTINLTFGEDLAWQERKGASFAFTPLYSGYHVGWTAERGSAPDTTFNGFVRTEDYAYMGGFDMPTVTAISGAAANPNQGYNSQPALAFLMTLFNVRLGWWVANPRKPKVWPCANRRPTPLFGPWYLLSELFGLSTDATKYVCLSDGGHFDNMGLYELVRRRCSLIVICDAEEDLNTTFEGIGLTVAKCRTDFGVEIELDLRPLQPDPVTKLSKAHFVVGHIHYPAPPGGDPADRKYTGTLVFLKTTLCGYEPADILHYKRDHEDFPQQSTANQWFTETQFESYRRLGELIGEEAAAAF